MKLKLIVAILALVAVPLYAQAQEKGAPKPTKADADRVVKMISADKAKVKIYCDMAKLDDQIAEADQKKDEKKADALGNQSKALADKLGPEFIALAAGLAELDPDSKESKDLEAALQPLDSLCGK